jgi:hypothetical protein
LKHSNQINYIYIISTRVMCCLAYSAKSPHVIWYNVIVWNMFVYRRVTDCKNICVCIVIYYRQKWRKCVSFRPHGLRLQSYGQLCEYTSFILCYAIPKFSLDFNWYSCNLIQCYCVEYVCISSCDWLQKYLCVHITYLS